MKFGGKYLKLTIEMVVSDAVYSNLFQDTNLN